MPPILLPRYAAPLWVDGTDLNLDISGVAGFFGGDVAVQAMTTVHIYEGRMYLGWYNMPGSYEIARWYGQIARSRFWDGLYPGPNLDPAVFFQLDGLDGPRFRGVQSGTIMRKTGHPAYLLYKECGRLPAQQWQQPPGARQTSPASVTVVHLHDVPNKIEHKALAKDENLVKTSFISFIPILASAATAAICALFDDWPCFSMITLGMFTGGVSCMVIGTALFRFTRPDPAPGSPPGHGIMDEGNTVIVLKGPEAAVSAITRGKFSLNYQNSKRYHRLGMSSLLLTVQFLTQLLVVPQGSILGQIMFLTSLGVSWVYNMYLSSLDREKLQRRILIKKVLTLKPKKGDVKKYTLGTRTAMVVFVLLVLASAADAPESQDGPSFGNELLERLQNPTEPQPSNPQIRISADDTVVDEKPGKDDPDEEEDSEDVEHPDDTHLRAENSDAASFSGPSRPQPADADALKEVVDDLLPNNTPVWRSWKSAILAQIPRLIDGDRLQRVQGGEVTLTEKKRRLLENLYVDAEAGIAAYRAYMRAMS